MHSTILRRTFDPALLETFDAVHPVLARIYASRGVTSTDELTYSLDRLSSYETLKDIDKAAEILAQALVANKTFVIVGDFDADGATSTTLAVRALRALGAQNVHFIVPNRFEFGYGLTPEIVALTEPFSPDVLITVDNGISSHAGVEAAKARGMQVVITDHHIAPETLPEADAIVNPNQPGCAFPSKHCAGVGVIFYVMAALRAKLKVMHWFENRDCPSMAQWLDIVALGTVADVVTLDYNNRIFVHQGLARIRAGQASPGIYALLQVASRNPARIKASDLGFAVGPRLNAAGRLTDMSIGIACLLSDSLEDALPLAQQLNTLNVERREIEADMQIQANAVLEKLQNDNERLPLGLALYESSWHQGVVGILASRIKEQFHRPVICFTDANEHELKGSARSVKGVHIRDVLDTVATQNPGMINKFGGHAMAAGLSIDKTQFEAFAQAFAEAVASFITHEDCVGQIFTDGALSGDALTLEFAKQLQQAGPFGQNFPEPVFDNEFIIMAQKPLNDQHCRYVFKDPETEAMLEGIHFYCEPDAFALHERVRVAYQLDVNEFRGFEKPQSLIQSIDRVEK